MTNRIGCAFNASAKREIASGEPAQCCSDDASMACNRVPAMKRLHLLLLIALLIAVVTANHLKAIRKLKHKARGVVIPKLESDPCGALTSVLKDLLATEQRRMATKHLKNALRTVEQYGRKGRRGARNCERMLKGLQG
uniref:Uncharacterized protein n=1 Tax=Trichuris muris TaxID=70415 RepID=A0A5S6QH97_TRIMR